MTAPSPRASSRWSSAPDLVTMQPVRRFPGRLNVSRHLRIAALAARSGDPAPTRGRARSSRVASTPLTARRRGLGRGSRVASRWRRRVRRSRAHALLLHRVEHERSSISIQNARCASSPPSMTVLEVTGGGVAGGARPRVDPARRRLHLAPAPRGPSAALTTGASPPGLGILTNPGRFAHFGSGGAPARTTQAASWTYLGRSTGQAIPDFASLGADDASPDTRSARPGVQGRRLRAAPRARHPPAVVPRAPRSRTAFRT